jgi:hypothetical protein
MKIRTIILLIITISACSSHKHVSIKIITSCNNDFDEEVWQALPSPRPLIKFNNKKYLTGTVVKISMDSVDSLYRYFNPMGVYKMDYKEYKYLSRISDSCDSKAVYLDTKRLLLIDRCDTVRLLKDEVKRDTIFREIRGKCCFYILN